MTRIATTLLALAIPLCAQEQKPVTSEKTSQSTSQIEAVFYKAYYLERGQRDFAGAMALYEEFLAKAPQHKLAKEAAKQQFRLLDRTGKTKERDAFKAKYRDLLGDLANVTSGRPPRGSDRGTDRPRRREGGFGGRPRGRMGGMRQVMALMRSDKKLADLDEEQMGQLEDYLAASDRNLDRLSRFLGEDVVAKLKAGAQQLKAALDADKMEDAQKALEQLRRDWPQMGRRRGRDGGGFGGRRGGSREGERPAGGRRGGRGGEEGGGGL
ncbi:MAG TPA: hypothetical protein ENI87_02610 [bacterium]|nr:hypothetical protein [bacterium]